MAQLNVGTGSAYSKGYLHKQISAPPPAVMPTLKLTSDHLAPICSDMGHMGAVAADWSVQTHLSLSPRYPEGWPRGSSALPSEAMLAAVPGLWP